MLRKFVMWGILASLATSPVQAQYRQLAFCDEIAPGGQGLVARFIIFFEPTNEGLPDRVSGVRVCNRTDGRQGGTACIPVFTAPGSDLVAARWVGPRELVIETSSLLDNGLQLHVSFGSQEQLAVSGMRLDLLGNGGGLPGSEEFAGERTTIADNTCELIPPPRAPAAQ